MGANLYSRFLEVEKEADGALGGLSVERSLQTGF